MRQSIRGLDTVNCGNIVTFSKNDCFDSNWKLNSENKIPLQLEILNPANHNTNCQIVCYYYWDVKSLRKVEITLCRDIRTKQWCADVFYFRTRNDTHHYTSRHYDSFVNMPKLQYEIIKWIHPCFIEVFGK